MSVPFATILATTILAACTSAAATNTRVAIIGDSITAYSKTQIVAELPDAAFFAVPGATPAQLEPALVAQAKTRPRVEIVEIGAGDSSHQLIGSWRADLQAAVRAVNGLHCVVWVTVPRAADLRAEQQLIRPLQPVAVDWNRRLRAAVRGRSNFRLVDWDRAIVADPARAVADGVHPTAAGSQWLADQYAAAARACR